MGKKRTILEASAELALSKNTLRAWESKGKIGQVPRHPRTKERQYDDKLIARIIRYRDEGK